MFFRAGVLGQMEELRDERLSKIMTWMQSWIRGYLSRKDFFKLQEQRLALQVVQRNLRKYLQLRTWPWYKLWTKVKPLLNVTRIEDEIAVSSTTYWRFPIAPRSTPFRLVGPGVLSVSISRVDWRPRRCMAFRSWHLHTEQPGPINTGARVTRLPIHAHLSS